MSDHDNPLEPVTGSEFFHRALELFEQGRFDDALRCIDNALALSHVDADTCLLKGQVLFELKQPDEALAWLGKASEFSPLNADVMLWKGRVLHAAHRHRAALANFNRVLDQDPLNAEAHLCRGMALFELGEWSRAQDSLREALDANGHNDERHAEINFWLAKVERALGRDRKAMRRLEQVIEKNPNHLPAFAELGDLYRTRATVDADALSRAREIYEKGLKADPNDPALHNDYGNLLRELRDLVGSLEHLSRAIAINADHEVAYFNRGLTHEEMGHPDAAIDDFRHAVRIDATDIDARLKIVDNLLLLDRVGEAWIEVEYALKLAPDNTEVVICAGDVLNRKALDAEGRGDYITARDSLARLIDLAPDLVNLDEFVPFFISPVERHHAAVNGYETLRLREAANGIGPVRTTQLMMAMHLSRLAEFPRVETMLREHLSRWPDDCFAHLLMAHLKSETGRAPEAVAHLDDALALRPEFVELLWEKAVLLESEPIRDLDGAVRCYRQILAHPGDHRWCHEPLARLYEELEMPQRALLHWRQHEAYLADVGDADRQKAHLAWVTARLLLELDRPAEAIQRLHEVLTAPQLARDAAASESSDEVGLSAPASRPHAEPRPLPPIDRNEVRLMVGLAYAQEGKLMQAREYLQKVVEESGDDPELCAEALAVLASVALRQRNLDDARMFLDEANAIDGGDTRERLLARAMLAYETRRFGETRHFIERVLMASPESDPVFLEAMYLFAKTAYRQRDWATCADVLGELLGEDPFFLRAIALHTLLARKRGDKAEVAAARVAFRVARRTIRANALLRRGEIAAAKALLLGCLDDAPDLADIHLALAAAMAGADDVAGACSALKVAWQFDPRIVDDVPREPLFDRLTREPQFVTLWAELGGDPDFTAFSASQISRQVVRSRHTSTHTDNTTSPGIPNPKSHKAPAPEKSASARVREADESDAQILHDAEFGIDWDSLDG